MWAFGWILPKQPLSSQCNVMCISTPNRRACKVLSCLQSEITLKPFTNVYWKSVARVFRAASRSARLLSKTQLSLDKLTKIWVTWYINYFTSTPCACEVAMQRISDNSATNLIVPTELISDQVKGSESRNWSRGAFHLKTIFRFAQFPSFGSVWGSHRRIAKDYALCWVRTSWTNRSHSGLSLRIRYSYQKWAYWFWNCHQVAHERRRFYERNSLFWEKLISYYYRYAQPNTMDTTFYF